MRFLSQFRHLLVLLAFYNVCRLIVAVPARVVHECCAQFQFRAVLQMAEDCVRLESYPPCHCEASSTMAKDESLLLPLSGRWSLATALSRRCRAPGAVTSVRPDPDETRSNAGEVVVRSPLEALRHCGRVHRVGIREWFSPWNGHSHYRR